MRSSETLGQEVIDDARKVSVMYHLWNTLAVLKERTDVAAWADENGGGRGVRTPQAPAA